MISPPLPLSPHSGSRADLEQVGRYDVLGKIDEGGFATLLLAQDRYLKRVVAIKICLSADAGRRHSFLREAEIAGRLDHPNVVRTLDFGFDQGRPYMVQEYLQGEDLSEIIKRRPPLSTPEKLGLLIGVARALSYLHSLEILHLDVKPANVRVLDDGQVKLLDFGIALPFRHGVSEPPAGMLGTAGYLPVEQIRGEHLDASADVFGFGAFAYELLTYSRPFRGDTLPEVLKSVLAGDVRPITDLWPECPPPLAKMVHRCLERERETRFGRFEEILPVLRALLRSIPIDVREEARVGDPAFIELYDRTGRFSALVPRDAVLLPEGAFYRIRSGTSQTSETGGGIDSEEERLPQESVDASATFAPETKSVPWRSWSPRTVATAVTLAVIATAIAMNVLWIVLLPSVNESRRHLPAAPMQASSTALASPRAPSPIASERSPRKTRRTSGGAERGEWSGIEQQPAISPVLTVEDVPASTVEETSPDSDGLLSAATEIRPEAGIPSTTATTETSTREPPQEQVVDVGPTDLPRRVLSLDVSEGEGWTEIQIQADRPIAAENVFSALIGVDAPRYLLRISGIVERYSPRDLEVDSPEVTRIRTGQHDTPRGPELHVVLDLPHRELDASIDDTGGVYHLRLRDRAR